jgi:hypothetical protein
VTVRTASKEERQLAYLWLVAAASAVVLKPLWLAIVPLLRPCVFRSLTGIPCPTCGTTRAATAFLDGNLLAAFTSNPLATVAGSVFIFGAPLAALWAVMRWPVPEIPSPLHVWMRAGVIGLLAVNWIYLIASA